MEADNHNVGRVCSDTTVNGEVQNRDTDQLKRFQLGAAKSKGNRTTSCGFRVVSGTPGGPAPQNYRIVPNNSRVYESGRISLYSFTKQLSAFCRRSEHKNGHSEPRSDNLLQMGQVLDTI